MMNNKIRFSVAIKRKGILTKILSLGKDGNVVKDGSECKMYQGYLETYHVSIENFRKGLEGLYSKTNKALVHGIPKNGATNVKLVTKRKYTGDKDTVITRTKDHIAYPSGPGLMMIDHDSARTDSVAVDDKALQVFPPDELIKIIGTIDDNIKGASYVSTTSTSSCIYNKDNKELRGPGSGAHIYLFPQVAKDIPRYLETLGKRLWIAGYGRIEISRSGAMLLRTLVDLTVGSPERLDFVSGAVCRDGLTQKRPAPVLCEGDLLDTVSFDELSDAEEDEYKKAVAEAKTLATPEQDRVKTAYIDKEAKKIVNNKPEITIDQAKKIIVSRQNHVLQLDDLLYFACDKGKPVSVSDAVNAKKKYDKQPLADPLEPEYDGSSMSKAIYYYNDGNPVINSFAHGNIKYRIDDGICDGITGNNMDNEDSDGEDSDGEEDGYYPNKTLKSLKGMNKEYAACLLSGKFRIIAEYFDFSEEKHTIDFLEIGSFHNFFSNKKVFVNTEKGTKMMPLSKCWQEWPKRITYRNVVFSPGNNISDQSYNLFRGFPINPKRGDWHLMQEHIYNILCCQNQKYFDYLLGWMARMVQDPGGKRPGVAVVLKGGKGVGKGIFANYFGKIFGEAFMPISTSKGFTGNFNSHLSKCLFVFLDEAIWGGDKQSEGQLKALITEPTMLFEPKGIDSVSLKSYINVLMASNEDWVCPATTDERRFFVLDCANDRQQDIGYFDAIEDEKENGGVEAMYYDLMQYKYELAVLRKAPKTAGLQEQVDVSLDDTLAFWRNALSRRYLLSDPKTGAPVMALSGAAVDSWPTEAFKYEIYNEFEQIFCKNRIHTPKSTTFWRTTWKFWPEGRIHESRHYLNGMTCSRVRQINLDSLETMRHLFETYTGVLFNDNDENTEIVPF